MATRRFPLPDVGEGLTEAEIVAWHVQPGDAVKVNDPIVDIETAKSIVELPCPWAGVVAELLVPAGETVPVGTPIIAVEVDTPAPAEAPEPGSSAPPAAAPAAPVPERQSNLVGYGPRSGTELRSRRRPQAPRTSAPAAPAPAPAAPVPAAPAPDPAAAAPAVAPSAPPAAAPARALAKPPVRKLAKDRGIDLRDVTPTGDGGVVTRADVEAFLAGAAAAPAVTRPGGADPRDTRIPIKGVRKATAQAMVASAFTAPHVTLWLAVDVTRSMRLLRRLKADPEFDGLSVSPLLLASRAVIAAVRRFPGVNARWDGDAGEIVQVGAVHLGIAVASPRGLLVPSLKDADRLSLHELATGLTGLARTAREGRSSPADLSGGTLTITNIGVFGVDGGTPILNPGESAILGLGQVRERPWVHKGAVRPRQVMELVLSVDHRVVDGELAGRFLADVGAMLERPDRLLARS
jgi:2-oxoisovalerate dehydrogenase E2 component (dihydrolipoyl transacylase)